MARVQIKKLTEQNFLYQRCFYNSALSLKNQNWNILNIYQNLPSPNDDIEKLYCVPKNNIYFRIVLYIDSFPRI